MAYILKGTCRPSTAFKNDSDTRQSDLTCTMPVTYSPAKFTLDVQKTNKQEEKNTKTKTTSNF